MTPDILFHNQVLLIIIASLKYFSRTEDLKEIRLSLVLWKVLLFRVLTFTGQEKGFDKTLWVSPRTYGGLNYIRFAELGKEVSQIQW